MDRRTWRGFSLRSYTGVAALLIHRWTSTLPSYSDGLRLLPVSSVPLCPTQRPYSTVGPFSTSPSKTLFTVNLLGKSIWTIQTILYRTRSTVYYNGLVRVITLLVTTTIRIHNNLNTLSVGRRLFYNVNFFFGHRVLNSAVSLTDFLHYIFFVERGFFENIFFCFFLV